jgi:mono/diheme cytochrome c family protein
VHHAYKAWWLFASALGAAALLCTTDREGWSQETTSSVQDGIYTDAQAARGASAYPQHCAACHGASLGGLTVGDLFDRIRTTMPLNNPAGLSRDQYADILSFILKSNGFPAGQKDLNRRSEFLNAIRFEPPAEAARSR